MLDFSFRLIVSSLLSIGIVWYEIGAVCSGIE